ncbi:Rho termination factor N-terminal domain-containing protein [Streptomyces sp. NPDC093591]|uniref:Rho termination factor N-terminal domain-containing protein n=1 Tax=Streptomyces sp. NPDC093591 TaxID=3366044 RepID=UPI0037F7CD26
MKMAEDPSTRWVKPLGSMTLAELQKLASDLGIKGAARMPKGQLIEVIREAQAGAGSVAAGAPDEEPAAPAVAEGRTKPRFARRVRLNSFGVQAIAFGTQLLPAGARERWQEEWRAEWTDLTELSRRKRLLYLLRLTLHAAPRLAWSLRRAQREIA